MEQKTKISAEEGRQELTITRQFDLPLHLLFKAYTEPELLEQWMGTRVLQLENRPHGSYRFETSDAKGNVVVKMNGVMHEYCPDEKITRTFEMENTPLPVQLEFLEFVALGEESSLLTIHIIYRSSTHRDQVLQMPFAFGINMAHNRLQEIVNQLKK